MHKPLELEVKRLLRPTRCGFGAVGKHHFQVDRKIHGGSVLVCKWTLCQERRVVANAVLKALVAR
jgi:hypothetical protein